MAYSKGSGPRDAEYAKGGNVLGKESNFMKIKDEFRDPGEANPEANEDQKYGKDGAGKGDGFVKPPKARKDKCID